MDEGNVVVINDSSDTTPTSQLSDTINIMESEEEFEMSKQVCFL